MTKRTREIIALAMLIVLVVAGLFVGITYLRAGHGWNIAASHLDDRFGDMEGYTVLVYQGNVKPDPVTYTSASTDKLNAEPKTAAGASSAQSSSSSSAAQGSGSRASSSSFFFFASSGSSSSSSRSEATVSSGSASSASSASKTGETLSAKDAASTLSDMRAAGSSSSDAVGSADEKAPLDSRSAAASYREKGATVFEVKCAESGYYEGPTVVQRDGRRIGIIRADESTVRIALEKSLLSLRNRNVDFTVVIADNLTQIADVADIDVAIIVSDATVSTIGESVGSMFVVATPTESEVGAVLVSPSNVVSAKVVER